MSVLYLTETEVRSLLTMDLALTAVESAFRKLSLDEAENVPRHRCQTDQVVLHVLQAAAKTLGALGFKAYTSSRTGGVEFRVFLFDPKAGGLIAVLEADYLGQVRTGAASGVATKLLSRPDCTRLGLLGTGGQARTQVEAICKVRPIEYVSVYSRTPEKRDVFAREMSERCGVTVQPVESAEEAVRNHDIITTATTSREPVLFGEWLSPGMHINLIGSNFLAKTESDVEVFRKASLVAVDCKDQAKLEAGDFVAPIRDGLLHWGDIYELEHLITGRYPGRQSAEDITIFKSLGLGIEDIAVAIKLVELARQQGLGRTIV